MILHQALNDWVIRYLTAELPGYQRRVPNDMDLLHAHVRPGDVVLVEGKSRISQVIMYLTQSSWSHAAMYIGDALLRWGGPGAEEALDQWGPDAAHLLIESDMRDGVIVVPLSKYEHHNIRVCRPHGLVPEDVERVLTEMLLHLGVRYDRRNIFDLARYLTPFHLLPRKLRRRPLYLGSSSSREVICSALIARAFYKVGYPVQPVLGSGRAEAPGGNTAIRGPRRMTVRHPSYIMPRDFDLSANFEVLKGHLLGGARLGYAPDPWA
ncbi:MAG TPA: YiiX/YebB-like N1pC/P60 family cysteine hydrolase [Holophagaceae bacterium]|nr:YiiX/YebB-like N1pC/P60 family cysteine hydrolase [Holophagaceae bacterium]